MTPCLDGPIRLRGDGHAGRRGLGVQVGPPRGHWVLRRGKVRDWYRNGIVNLFCTKNDTIAHGIHVWWHPRTGAQGHHGIRA
jgi:hypothetical protein